MRTGELGFWWRSLGEPGQTRPSLPSSTEADVAIVGAGYTGLWTAYYLARARPSLRVVVLERDVAGFGASARNGGWVSGFFAGPSRTYEKRRGRAGLVALQRAMFETVDEVGGFLAAHEIEADFVKAGQLTVAVGEAQALRLRESVKRRRDASLEEEDLRLLAGPELADRVHVAGARCGSFTPHVARVQPAKLLVGLAKVVEQLGVTIHEGTAVLAVRPHEALTATGSVRARWIVRATEGYTASLRGLKRVLAPINSSMIITEPLPDAAWHEIGWSGCELLGDGAHVYSYLQRTADGRIAIGGRGVPYRYGSRTDGAGNTARATIAALRAKLAQLFPPAAGIGIDHAWSGVLGVPRDWCMSVQADPASGLAAAGGYVGQGVASANLAARTLRDLVLGEHSALVELPLPAPAPRRWEPEPIRWSAITGVYGLYRLADDVERRTGRQSRLARVADIISGRD